jgi:hypothetical protein
MKPGDYKSEKYYFQLKSGGYYFLDSIMFNYRILPMDATVREYEKIDSAPTSVEIENDSSK